MSGRLGSRVGSPACPPGISPLVGIPRPCGNEESNPGATTLPLRGPDSGASDPPVCGTECCGIKNGNSVDVDHFCL